MPLCLGRLFGSSPPWAVEYHLVSKLNKAEKKEPVLRESCGSRKGYQAHHYNKEKACQPCTEANATRFRAWYEKNKEKERARFRNNRLDPIYNEKRQAANRKRRAIIKGAESDDYSVQDILHIYGIACHLCGETIDLTAPRKPGVEGWEKGLHLDHVMSLYYGGKDTVDNVKPSHAVCNLKKQSGKYDKQLNTAEQIAEYKESTKPLP